MKRRYDKKESLYLIKFASITMVILLILGIQLMGSSVYNTNSNEHKLQLDKALFSAESGLEITKAVLWNEYLEQSNRKDNYNNENSGSLVSYRKYLNEQNIYNDNQIKLFEFVIVGEEQTVDSVLILRSDTKNSCNFIITSYGKSGNGQISKLIEYFKVEIDDSKGFSFVALSEKSSCINCHSNITDIQNKITPQVFSLEPVNHINSNCSAQEEHQIENRISKLLPKILEKNYSTVIKTAIGNITGGEKASVLIDASTRPLHTTSINRIANSHEGSLVLKGTTLDPILIDGEVAIAGDLILSGIIKGAGQLFVRGNIYIFENLTYADGMFKGKRTFGKGPQGHINALSLVAGSNIFIGSNEVLNRLQKSKDFEKHHLNVEFVSKFINQNSDKHDLLIDGQLVAQKMIFGDMSGKDKSNRILTINGNLVAPEILLYSTEPINLNFDSRLLSYLNIEQFSDIKFIDLKWYNNFD